MKKIYLQIILFLNLFLVIIWYYPTIIDFLIIHNHHYSIPNEDNKIDLIAERGTFGDMFGLLNTIFSGLALLGIIYTVYEEKEKSRNDRRQLQIDKLKYFSGLLKYIKRNIYQVQNYYSFNMDFLSSDPHNIEYVLNETTPFEFDRFDKLISNLNEEEYYLAFIDNLKLTSSEYEDGSEKIFSIFNFLNDFSNSVKILALKIQKDIMIINRNKLKIIQKLEIAINESQIREDVSFIDIYDSWVNSRKEFKDLDEYVSSLICVDIPYKNKNGIVLASSKGDEILNILLVEVCTPKITFMLHKVEEIKINIKNHDFLYQNGINGINEIEAAIDDFIKKKKS